MKHPQKLGQMIFAAVFFCSVIGYGALNLWYAKEPLAENVQEAWDNIREEPAAETVVSAVADLDTAVTENTLFRYPLLECYGGMQLALGKHEENAFDVVKDKDGYLHGGNFWTGFGDDTKELAVRVRRLADAMEERGTKVGFVLPPMKVVRQQAAYTGIPYNDFTEQADSLLRWLRYYSVPYLDLRESLKDDNLSYEETYYKTDHHWSPLAAFAGFRDTVEWMNFQWNAGLDPAGDFRDLSQYETKNFPGLMLGSQGRDAGVVYSGGTEDYQVYYPKSGGDFTWIHGEPDHLESEEGAFVPTLLQLETKRGLYELAASNLYLNSVQEYDSIENHSLEDGASVLLLRDSYASPLAAFLSQCCGQLDMLWAQKYSGDEMMDYLEAHDYDYILVMLYPENLTYENFPFYESEGL